MIKRKTPWVRHCKKCGRFITKAGKHPGGKCKRTYVKTNKPSKGALYQKLMAKNLNEALEPGEFIQHWQSIFGSLSIDPEPNPYLTAANEIATLVAGKQAAYGDSFGKSGGIMRILYPEGVRPEQMNDALTIVRVIDKLFRIATDKDAFGENPWKDIMGYSLLAYVKEINNNTNQPKKGTV